MEYRMGSLWLDDETGDVYMLCRVYDGWQAFALDGTEPWSRPEDCPGSAVDGLYPYNRHVVYEISE